MLTLFFTAVVAGNNKVMVSFLGDLKPLQDADQQTDKSKPALLSAKEAISLWILGTRKVCRPPVH